MTSRTIYQKLERLHDLRVAEEKDQLWWVNPNEHPDPTLPEQEYLNGAYLDQIAASQPQLFEKAKELVCFAGKERK